jgi:pimeloyl-ACP methyl ester carboxylesterase
MTNEIVHHFALAEGVRLHWAELGEAGHKVPLVLLHGLYDSHLTWRHVAPALARERRVLMPDLPGHGLSARPDASYELGWHARLIAAWLKEAGVEQADVVGHSYGGGVAQMLLLECRERVRRLVLVASGGLGREVGMPLRLAAVPLVVELFGQPFMGLGTLLALSRVHYTNAELDELRAMNEQPGSARAFARTVRDILDWRGQRRAFLHRAHEVRELPPMAVHWGDRDRVIPVSHAQSFLEAVEGVSFRRFEGCGHYLHVEQPELFVQSVDAFLDSRSVSETHLRGATTAPPRALGDDRQGEDGGPKRKRSRLEVKDIKELAERVELVVDKGIATVSEVHRKVARVPFSSLEVLPVIATPARKVRALHNGISGLIYASLGRVNHAVCNGIATMCTVARDHDSLRDPLSRAAHLR